MGMSDGSVVAAVRLVDHGPDEDKMNLVITGDGFTLAELGDFVGVVDDFVAYMQTVNPFSSSLQWDKINIHRIDVVSDGSGADNPDCDGTVVATYFDAEFCVGGEPRRLSVDETLAMDTANIHVPEWDVVLVFVNSNVFGGSATGSVATASLAVNEWGALHEVGHAGFGLADEYCAEDGGIYTGSEPNEPNVTATLVPLKWQLYVDVGTPIPTTSNPDLTGLTCDVQPSPVADGTVGAFEGAKYVGRGLYRPEYDCIMRTALPVPFCAVCVGAILDELWWQTYFDPTPCLVATAVYGDQRHPDVVTLRGWRDRHLAPGARGAPAMRLLAAGYARAGPVLARLTQPRPRLARLLRTRIFAPWARLLRRREGTVR